MNNDGIARGLMRISNILKIKRMDSTRDYESRMNAARETANTMLAMLDEPPVIQPLKYDYNKVFKTPAPAGTLTVVEVPADDEITRLLKELLASFGIGEKEPEQKRCGNCGMSNITPLEEYVCNEPLSVYFKCCVPRLTCGLPCWTPRKEAAVNE